MDILQIWINENEPKKQNLNAMAYNKDKSNNYTLISDFNFLDCDNWINVDDYISDNNINLNFKMFGKYETLVKSDYIRFHYATNNNVLYLDVDCKWLKDFDIDHNKPVFPLNNKLVDYYAFYTNNDKLFFENLLDKIEFSFKRKLILTPLFRLNSSFFYNKIFKLDKSCFKHYNNKSWKK